MVARSRRGKSDARERRQIGSGRAEDPQHRVPRPGEPLTALGVLALGQHAGNHAVQRMLKVQRVGSGDGGLRPTDEEDAALLARLNAPVATLAPAPEFASPFPEPQAAVQPGLATRVKRGGYAAGRGALSRGGGIATGLAGAASLGATAIDPASRGELVTTAGGLGPVMSGRASTNVGAGQGTSVGGAGLGVGLGGLSMGLGAYSLYSGYSRRKAQARTNRAGARMGGRAMASGGWMMAGGATGVAAGGLEIAALAKGSGASSALSTGAFGLMAAGGAVTAARSMWKLGKSLSKLSSLGGVKPVTDEGERWLAKAKEREKTKAKVSGLKTPVGGLGIASAGLLKAGNPIGWALGLGAAALGGFGAIIGLTSKVDQEKQSREDEEGHVSDASRLAHQALASKTASQRAQTNDPAERKKIRLATGEASAALHSNLQVGKQMQEAARTGEAERAAPVLAHAQEGDEAPFAATSQVLSLTEPGFQVPQMPDFQAVDAIKIAGALNVSEEELRSDAGAELVQSKISAAEVM